MLYNQIIRWVVLKQKSSVVIWIFFLKLFTLNTHIQNDRIERFRWFIIKKAYTIRLLANLSYKFWRKIVAAAIYLYNQMP